MRLMRGGAMSTGRPVYSGAFLIVANTLTRNQTVQLTNDGAGKTDDNFGLQLTAFAEPKLRVLRAGNMVKLEEATDDKGNSLVPGPNAAPRDYGYYSGAGAWHLFANLQYPKDPGTRITRLRASATFTVQTRSQKVEVNNLPSVKEHVQMAGGTRVTIHEFKKVGDSQYQLRMRGLVQNLAKVPGGKCPQRGHSRPGRTSSKSGHVRYSAKSRSKFSALSVPLATNSVGSERLVYRPLGAKAGASLWLLVVPTIRSPQRATSSCP